MVDARDSKSRASDGVSVRVRLSAPFKFLYNLQKIFNMDSIFTKIIKKEIPSNIVAETEDLIVIKDINPKAPIHFLIIPKKQISNIIEMEELDFIYGKHIFSMAKYLSENIPGAKEFKLIMNNGKSAGQVVFHAHVHFLAGKIFSE